MSSNQANRNISEYQQHNLHHQHHHQQHNYGGASGGEVDYQNQNQNNNNNLFGAPQTSGESIVSINEQLSKTHFPHYQAALKRLEQCNQTLKELRGFINGTIDSAIASVSISHKRLSDELNSGTLTFLNTYQEAKQNHFFSNPTSGNSAAFESPSTYEFTVSDRISQEKKLYRICHEQQIKLDQDLRHLNNVMAFNGLYYAHNCINVANILVDSPNPYYPLLSEKEQQEQATSTNNNNNNNTGSRSNSPSSTMFKQQQQQNPSAQRQSDDTELRLLKYNFQKWEKEVAHPQRTINQELTVARRNIERVFYRAVVQNVMDWVTFSSCQIQSFPQYYKKDQAHQNKNQKQGSNNNNINNNNNNIAKFMVKPIELAPYPPRSVDVAQLKYKLKVERESLIQIEHECYRLSGDINKIDSANAILQDQISDLEKKQQELKRNNNTSNNQESNNVASSTTNSPIIAPTAQDSAPPVNNNNNNNNNSNQQQKLQQETQMLQINSQNILREKERRLRNLRDSRDRLDKIRRGYNTVVAQAKRYHFGHTKHILMTERAFTNLCQSPKLLEVLPRNSGGGGINNNTNNNNLQQYFLSNKNNNNNNGKLSPSLNLVGLARLLLGRAAEIGITVTVCNLPDFRNSTNSVESNLAFLTADDIVCDTSEAMQYTEWTKKLRKNGHLIPPNADAATPMLPQPEQAQRGSLSSTTSAALPSSSLPPPPPPPPPHVESALDADSSAPGFAEVASGEDMLFRDVDWFIVVVLDRIKELAVNFNNGNPIASTQQQRTQMQQSQQQQQQQQQRIYVPRTAKELDVLVSGVQQARQSRVYSQQRLTVMRFLMPFRDLWSGLNGANNLALLSCDGNNENIPWTMMGNNNNNNNNKQSQSQIQQKPGNNNNNSIVVIDDNDDNNNNENQQTRRRQRVLPSQDLLQQQQPSTVINIDDDAEVLDQDNNGDDDDGVVFIDGQTQAPLNSQKYPKSMSRGIRLNTQQQNKNNDDVESSGAAKSVPNRHVHAFTVSVPNNAMTNPNNLSASTPIRANNTTNNNVNNEQYWLSVQQSMKSSVSNNNNGMSLERGLSLNNNATNFNNMLKSDLNSMMMMMTPRHVGSNGGDDNGSMKMLNLQHHQQQSVPVNEDHPFSSPNNSNNNNNMNMGLGCIEDIDEFLSRHQLNQQNNNNNNNNNVNGGNTNSNNNNEHGGFNYYENANNQNGLFMYNAAFSPSASVGRGASRGDGGMILLGNTYNNQNSNNNNNMNNQGEPEPNVPFTRKHKNHNDRDDNNNGDTDDEDDENSNGKNDDNAVDEDGGNNTINNNKPQREGSQRIQFNHHRRASLGKGLTTSTTRGNKKKRSVIANNNDNNNASSSTANPNANTNDETNADSNGGDAANRQQQDDGAATAENSVSRRRRSASSRRRRGGSESDQQGQNPHQQQQNGNTNTTNFYPANIQHNGVSKSCFLNEASDFFIYGADRDITKILFQISPSVKGQDRKMAQEAVEQLGARVLAGLSYDPAATHLVAANGPPERTEKYLAFRAAGKKIVTLAYLLDSCDRGFLLKEEKYNPVRNIGAGAGAQSLNNGANPVAAVHEGIGINNLGFSYSAFDKSGCDNSPLPYRISRRELPFAKWRVLVIGQTHVTKGITNILRAGGSPSVVASPQWTSPKDVATTAQPEEYARFVDDVVRRQEAFWSRRSARLLARIQHKKEFDPSSTNQEDAAPLGSGSGSTDQTKQQNEGMTKKNNTDDEGADSDDEDFAEGGFSHILVETHSGTSAPCCYVPPVIRDFAKKYNTQVQTLEMLYLALCTPKNYHAATFSTLPVIVYDD